jgi:hypothetical protein
MNGITGRLSSETSTTGLNLNKATRLTEEAPSTGPPEPELRLRKNQACSSGTLSAL